MAAIAIAIEIESEAGAEIVQKCPMCGKLHGMMLPRPRLDEYYAGCRKYAEGALIQDAFPGFSASEREFIRDGYCPECQSVLFGAKSDFVACLH